MQKHCTESLNNIRMQIQIGCTTKPNYKLWQHTLASTMLGYRHVCLCHADHNSQSFVLFVFPFYTKIPVLVMLVTEKEKKKKRKKLEIPICVPIWKEQRKIDLLAHIYGIFTYGIYTSGEQTWTKGQFGHGEFTSLHLSSSRGKGTAGLTAEPGRQSTRQWAKKKGVWSILRKRLEWLQNSRHLQGLIPTTAVGAP